MKKLIVFLCLFFSIMALYAKGIQEDYRKAEENARVSYAFGMVIASNIHTIPLDIDTKAFAEGMKAIFDETIEAQFTEQEALEIVEMAFHNAMEMLSEKNQMTEEQFLAANRLRPGVQTTASGLQYEVIEDKGGEKPNVNSVVRVNYTGTFIDGALFDSSIEEGGAYIPLELVIPGWTEGLMLMSTGSIYKLFIPSNLAYGKDGIQGIIPPYSTLIFSVELLEIISDEGYWDTDPEY